MTLNSRIARGLLASAAIALTAGTAMAADIKPAIIRAYVKEAIALKEAGQRIAPDRAKPLTIPPELRAALKADPKANETFKALSKSLRREYADHIASAKQAATRDRRIEKIMPMIRSGVGLHDKYRR